MCVKLKSFQGHFRIIKQRNTMISYNSFEVINNHTSQDKLCEQYTRMNKIHGKGEIECIIHAKMASVSFD